MLNIEKILADRGVPDAMIMKSGRRVKTVKDFEKRREEIKKILEEEAYGTIPPKPDHMKVEEVHVMPNFCAGKAPWQQLKFTFTMGDKEFSFPVSAVIPKSDKPLPAFVHINFRDAVPDRYMPSEELVDRGYAVFSFCYTDVSSDDGNFKDKCAKYLSNRRKKNASSKICIWAWAAMRVMDYIETLDSIDKDNVAVIGHSRLGKTAMVAGGYDERFKYIISNDSGCGGAAITRGKVGETFEWMSNVIPFWFCPRWLDKVKAGIELPYDQNFLAALSVPRHLMIGSAETDEWSDPESEFLNCASTNPAYALYGKRGLVYGDEIPKAKTVLGEGDALYHIRTGDHYFSREDWLVYMEYIDKQLGR